MSFGQATKEHQQRRVRDRIAATPNQVLSIVCVGIVLANLDLFIVNVGLPNIAHNLKNESLEQLSWILNGLGPNLSRVKPAERYAATAKAA